MLAQKHGRRFGNYRPPNVFNTPMVISAVATFAQKPTTRRGPKCFVTSIGIGVGDYISKIASNEVVSFIRTLCGSQYWFWCNATGRAAAWVHLSIARWHQPQLIDLGGGRHREELVAADRTNKRRR